MRKCGPFAAVAMSLALAVAVWTDRCASAAGVEPVEKLWSLARTIQDFADSPPLAAPSPFARDGWNRIGDRLSALKDVELETAKSDPGEFVRLLLAGKDRDEYCAQLDKIASGGHINISLELLQARDVAVALIPHFVDLVNLALTRPGAESLRQAMMAKIDAIVVNDRLSTEIAQFAEPLSARLLVLDKPEAWPEKTWPPTSQRLTILADALRHVASDKPIICSNVSLPAPSSQTIKDARVLAQTLTDAVTAWATAYAPLPELTASAAPATRPVSIPKSVRILPAATKSTDWIAHVALTASAADPSLYNVVIEADIEGHTVQWPIGVTVDEVLLDKAGQPYFVPRRLVPNVSIVDGATLRAALIQIGLPQIVKFEEKGEAIVSPQFDRIVVNIPMSVGDIYQERLHLVLVKDGKSAVAASLKDELARIRGDIAARLKAAPPSLQFAGNSIAIERVQVAVAESLTRATVEGKLLLRPKAATAGLLDEDLTASIKLAVPLEKKNSFQLVDAKWPEGVMDKLRKSLVGRLLSLDG
jgi:hypothetical protein